MIKEDDFPIIDRIKLLRKKSGLSQAKFADLIGASSGNVGQWERYMALPSASALRSIALKLECSTDWILFGQSINQVKETTLDKDQEELLSVYNGLDSEGKSIVKTTCYTERRRMNSSNGQKQRQA